MINGKIAKLSIDRPEEVQCIARALSSPIRIDILRLLNKRSYTIAEIAATLNLPLSSVSLSVKILEEAGLIRIEQQPGVHGTVKLCSRSVDHIGIELDISRHANLSCLTVNVPIGGYSNAYDIVPTCGLAGDNYPFDLVDDIRAFYMPTRFDAQIIWARHGILEYQVSLPQASNFDIKWLEISFEACSEAPMHRDPWLSDIVVQINDKRLGVWTSPCDCGGRHGRLTPEWWSDLNTQFGFLKVWRVDHTGCYLDGEHISDVTLDMLELNRMPYASIKIGNPKDAQHVGGFNIFGEKFGDYAQAIVIRTGYSAGQATEILQQSTPR